MPLNATGTIGVSAIGGVDIWLTILVITAIMTIGIILLIFQNFSRYKKMRIFLGFIGKCFIYFGKGLIGLGIFASFYCLLLLFGMGITSGTINLAEILWWIAIALAGFFGIAGLGYVLDRFLWRRIREYNKRYKKARK